MYNHIIGMAKQTDLMKGTLQMLVLKTLVLEPRHGVGIAERIAQITNGTFDVKAGSLFPALHRLEQAGFIRGEWSATAEGYRAKYYKLTSKGHRQLTVERRNWSRVATAIQQILDVD